MNIEVFLLANGAGTENGLLNVHGGGWEYYAPAFFPWTIRGAACGIATLSDEELGTTPVLVFEATAQDGQELGWRASITIDGVRPATTAGVPVRVPFFVALAMVVSAPTIVKVTLSHEGRQEAAVNFAVHDSVPDEPPTA